MLKRGAVLTELFKQPKSKPYSNFEETTLLLAYNMDVLCDIEIKKLKRFCALLLQYVKTDSSAAASKINTLGFMDESDEKAIISSIKEFKEIYDEQYK